MSGGIVSELAVVVNPPTISGVVGGDGAGVVASGDLFDSFAIEQAGVAGGDEGGDETLGGGIISELAADVTSPTIGGVVGGDGAGMHATSGDLFDSFAIEQAGVAGADGGGDETLSGGIVSESAVGVIPPTISGVVGGDGAGMHDTSRDLFDSFAIEQAGVGGGDAGGDETISGGVVSESAVGVIPPTISGVVGGDGAGVIATSRDLFNSFAVEQAGVGGADGGGD